MENITTLLSSIQRHTTRGSLFAKICGGAQWLHLSPNRNVVDTSVL